ncbi:MAG: DUF5110 domain-containing protein [Clostridia bacterium]|nr:DUF5110 domain-containing protein [Clostridia bacterium]
MDRYLLDVKSKTNAAQIVTFGKIRVSVITPRLIRVEKGIFRDEPTQKVWYRDFCKTEYTVDKRNGKLIVKTNEVSFEISAEGKVVVILGDKRISNFKKGNLKGTARTLDNVVGSIPLKDGVVSRLGVTMMDDSRGLSIVDGEIQPLQKGINDKYYFAYGEDYRRALRDFYSLCGQAPLIPKYSLGNWWSRYKAYTQDEYVSLMKEFIKRKIPVTVATIDMDWHWVDVVKRFGEDAKSHGDIGLPYKIFSALMPGWTGYTWNTELFPDYKGMLAWLKENGFHVTLNVHPAQGVRYYEKQYEEMCYRLGLEPKLREQILFDLSNPEFIKAYFDVLHKPYEKEGVDFWWIDWQQGKKNKVEGLDPLWALNHYHYLDSARDGKRPLILSRYAEAGSHRYPLGFSGDTFITWSALRFQPYFTATAGNIGYTWWSHDIGGHQRGKKDDELYIRWIQLGVFSPINRLHSSVNEFTGKEPWKSSKQAENIAVSFLRLRQKLIPFLYSAAYRTHKKGIAICEPLYYKYKNKEAYEYANEYVFGHALLCAPITEPTSKRTKLASVKVWLPEDARYTDIFTGEIYKGGGEVVMYRDLESFPCLAKEGTMIPLYADDESNSLGLDKPLEIWVYRGTGVYSLYEDEGENLDFEKGEYSVTKLSINESATGYSFEYKENEDGELELPKRKITVVFKDVLSADVKVNGKSVTSERDDLVAVTFEGGNAVVTLENCKYLENRPKKELMIDRVSRYQTATTAKLFKFLPYVKGKGKLHCVKKCEKGPLKELDALYYGDK